MPSPDLHARCDHLQNQISREPAATDALNALKDEITKLSEALVPLVSRRDELVTELATIQIAKGELVALKKQLAIH